MSAPIIRVGDLEINQDLRVQAHMWRIQRIGWMTIAIIVVLAAAGLFGHGPVSYVTAGDESGALQVEYERFGRHQSQSRLHLHVRASQAEGPVSFWISSNYLKHIEIQDMTPMPSKSTIAEDGILFHVDTAIQERSGLITVYFQFHSMGWLTGEIRMPGAASVTIRQFVYP
jgi:hypothetical protein